jgi:ribosomal protein S18 acetylase RimI-like enzyme
MSLETRRAGAADEDTVVRLLGQLLGEPSSGLEAWRETYRALLESERGEIVVALDEGRVVGVITFSVNVAIRYGGSYAQIEELVIDESCRGKGAGAALVKAAIASARARGCREIGLYARENNRPFYEKLGFEYAGLELRQPLGD